MTQMNPNHRTFLMAGEILCFIILIHLGWEWYNDGYDFRELMGAALGLPFHLAFLSFLLFRYGPEVMYFLPGKLLAAFLASVGIVQGLGGVPSLGLTLPSFVVYLLVNTLGLSMMLLGFRRFDEEG